MPLLRLCRRWKVQDDEDDEHDDGTKGDVTWLTRSGPTTLTVQVHLTGVTSGGNGNDWSKSPPLALLAVLVLVVGARFRLPNKVAPAQPIF